MNSNQGGVKLSVVLLSVIVLGVMAWFNQANAEMAPAPQQTEEEAKLLPKVE
ncbi:MULTISPECIES: hypothetical protein [unclassified Pseudoalteromonas]|uniref:hypothetical protein n=1 Tax=unclassified Pseudoalteromonas TaxID=194690 RepID=UPI00209784ED|nr:hypothetical protein [Pseudoalteromonas sp. XMcav2-N]MCO7186961.1 hypothetical protein [Pseudoalteromonas sp. XMcav2-N]